MATKNNVILSPGDLESTEAKIGCLLPTGFLCVQHVLCPGTQLDGPFPESAHFVTWIPRPVDPPTF